MCPSQLELQQIHHDDNDNGNDADNDIDDHYESHIDENNNGVIIIAKGC